MLMFHHLVPLRAGKLEETDPKKQKYLGLQKKVSYVSWHIHKWFSTLIVSFSDMVVKYRMFKEGSVVFVVHPLPLTSKWLY